jgi:hypothetical protein
VQLRLPYTHTLQLANVRQKAALRRPSGLNEIRLTLSETANHDVVRLGGIEHRHFIVRNRLVAIPVTRLTASYSCDYEKQQHYACYHQRSGISAQPFSQKEQEHPKPCSKYDEHLSSP